ncbi:hypothetical protein QFC21_003623 [Naganishia friedmannii]|uniref:Uncharacterized protein n=1 Tax=Naganishia friedmannii TaxID=89922 RepID=A0ACC2VN64_9TREE|nr:hypothetical protein QFC21_003623 [Naganishia friedmannii]
MPRRSDPTNHPIALRSGGRKRLHHPPSKNPSHGPNSHAHLPMHKQPCLPNEVAILDVISASLAQALDDPNLAVKIQQIKALLYEKRFLEVFETESWLDIYAARWVPSRALAFREIFDSIGLLERSEEVAEFTKGKGKENAESTAGTAVAGTAQSAESPRSAQKVICIGGGAGSELVALCAVVTQQLGSTNDQQHEESLHSESETEETKKAEPETTPATESSSSVIPPLDIHLLDIGPYGELINSFQDTCLSVLPGLSSDATNAIFHQIDILAPACTPLFENLLTRSTTQPPIITLLFTMTELFIQSRPRTIAFLRMLSRFAPRGTLFLVVDSANEEASAVTVGKEGRSWSLGMVMDGILCTPPPAATTGSEEPAPKAKALWRKMESEDSKWYRLREGLQDHYPIKMENTRYWLRLYRRN